jgi:hypothetical protein
MTLAVTLMGPSSVAPSQRNAAWNISVQIADTLTIAMELIVLGTIAIWSMVTRNRINFETQEIAEEKFFYSLSRAETIENGIARKETVERPLPPAPLDKASVPIAKPSRSHPNSRRQWTDETPALPSGAESRIR